MNKLHNNKGFSLVEIIITIALMAIVTGATMSIYSWIRTQRIENLAEKVSDSLNETRTNTVSKDGHYYLEIKKHSKNYKAILYKYNDSTSSYDVYKEYDLGKFGTIKVYNASGTERTITTSNWLEVEYDKSSGGVFRYKICATGIAPEDGNYKIVFQYENLERELEISKITGKHY